MNVIKEEDFRKEIKAKPGTGYLFYGEEDYLKQYDLNLCRKLVCPDPSFAFFNDMRLDGLDFTPDKLIDALMPAPVMAERKVVSVTGLDFTTMKASDLEALCGALAMLREYDFNLLVISVSAGKIDPGYSWEKPSAIVNKLGAYLTPVSFERSTPAKLATWVQKHFTHAGVRADSLVCQQLLTVCGHNMFVLLGEMDKIAAYVLAHGQTVVTLEDIRTVAAPNAEYGAFAFSNAILEHRTEDAMAILADLHFRRVEPLYILSEIIGIYCDMVQVKLLATEGRTTGEIAAALHIHEYKAGLYQKCTRSATVDSLRRTLAKLSQADAAMKHSSPGYETLEQFLCSL